MQANAAQARGHGGPNRPVCLPERLPSVGTPLHTVTGARSIGRSNATTGSSGNIRGVPRLID